MGILFLILPLLLLIASVFYVAKRLKLFFSTPSVKKWLMILGGLTLLAFAGGLAFSNASSTIGKPLGFLSLLWLLTILYAVFVFAIVDFANLLLKLKPIIRGYFSLGLLAAVMVYGIANAYILNLKEVTIPVEGLTKPIRAVQLTDIHLGNSRGKNYLEKIVRKTIELRPDVVFNTGDLFDSKAHFRSGTDVLAPFKKLTVPHFFIDGNHDQYVGVDEVYKLAKNAGAIVLRNEIADFGELQIVGLNNMPQDSTTFDMHTVPGPENIENVLNKLTIDQNRPSIVLHHRPVGVEYMNAKGVDVLLSGHTHAGQTFPFTLVARAMFPYLKGLYTYKNMSIYVSEGEGTIFLPFRFGTSSEITLIHLVPKQK